MSRTLKVAGTITVLLLVGALVMAAANAQTSPQPTNVTATNTADGHVLVSWADDAAPIHRVGWAHDVDARAANAAGDWLEAFHFADSKRNTDYTIKYLPRGQKYWFIVGATNERFTGATWSEWTFLTTEPTPTPARISLSDVDNSRGYNLTVLGSGFNRGSSATVYVLNTVSAPGSCQALIAHSSSVAVGSATVGADRKVAVSFPVAVPPFRGGQNNFICMADGYGRSSNDIEQFHLEATIRAVPSAASVGATVTVFAQDFPNPGAAFTGITLAGQPVTGASGTSIGTDGSATATFTVPTGFNGIVSLRAQWGETSKTTRIRITP